MFDVHTHIIPNVDDGSSSLETSINLLRKEISSGVTDIICTPHYRKNMFETSITKIKENFQLLVNEVKRLDLKVNLYLGQEIFIRRIDAFNDYLQNECIISMNNSLYYLLEFSYTNNIDISEVTYNLYLKNYKAIIAHVERYEYLKIEDIKEIKNTGALIQVNASAIVGKDGSKIQKKVMNLIKEDLVDFIASDIHESRENYMKKAYEIVVKKFNINIADKVFKNEIIKNL